MSSIHFWEPRPERPAELDREHYGLAKAIIEASDSMPEPEKHMLWLLGLKKEALKERLAIIKSQSGKYRREDRKSEVAQKQKELAYA